jgi:hypothetical protein
MLIVVITLVAAILTQIARKQVHKTDKVKENYDIEIAKAELKGDDEISRKISM